MNSLDLKIPTRTQVAARRAWIVFLGGGALLIAAYFWLVGEALDAHLMYNAAGVAVAGAMIVGVAPLGAGTSLVRIAPRVQSTETLGRADTRPCWQHHRQARKKA